DDLVTGVQTCALPISRTWVEHAINGGMREKLPRFFGALLDGEFVSRDDGPQLHECTYRRIHRHEIRVDHRNRRVANPTLCAPTRSEEHTSELQSPDHL